jgi:hypothetical protein
MPGHSASLRAFTPVFDGLWTRVNALTIRASIENFLLEGMDCRVTSAFARVFNALCSAITSTRR